MKPITKIGLAAIALAAGAALVVPAVAQYSTQGRPPIANPETSVNDPVGPIPNPANIPFTLNKDFKWPACATTPCRQQTINLWGNPSQPGPYGLLIKWYPGNFSAPHAHDKTRWIYVVEGTWWVSTSNVHDVRTTYPMRAGTYVVNEGGKTHWDGARAGGEPGVILLTGVGPVVTTQIGPDGNPLPPAPGRGAGGGAAPAGRGN